VKQNKSLTLIGALLALTLIIPVRAQTTGQLTGHNVTVTAVTYNGRNAVRLIGPPDAPNGGSYAIVRNTNLRDGTIEAEVAGKPAEGAGPDARGFIGIAFRMQGDKYEYIYLRPTNGRADDQVRRNHSTQYSSFPDFDYARLRQEAPEKYESYVDLQPGVWTKLRIEVDGRAARLYVNGAEQPCLIVNDLKLEPRAGSVALWIGPGTEGYFSDLKITPKNTIAATGASTQIYFDQAHGEFPPPPPMTEIGSRLGYAVRAAKGPITPESLKGSRLVYLRAPNITFAAPEKAAIVSFVKQGGSLLLVLDEEQRQSLAKTGVNDIIAPFGMTLSGDTPRIPNTGAMAKAGEINKADREVPYDGGREVFGGTPFAYQLDRQGHLAQPYAAYAKVDAGGRVVVLAEGMASLFLGSNDAVRMYIDPADPDSTKWWGKDSATFMQELIAWLLAR
jgi:hypothetical protein